MFGPRFLFDRYEHEELQPSWCSQLDTVGMQPHSREFLERDMTSLKGIRSYERLTGELEDFPEGIQFSDMP